MKRLLVAFLLLVATACRPVVTPYNPVDKALQSVSHITGTEDLQGMKVNYGCTAWAIDARKFVTANHCVGDDMKLDGEKATVILQDPTDDLAVVIADVVKPGLHVRKAPLVRDEEVIALGYGYNWKFPTITRHRVMMTNYSPYPDDMVPGVWYSNGFIGGMSGGPVVDANGSVVGVVQRGSSQVGYGVEAATLIKFLSSTVVILD